MVAILPLFFLGKHFIELDHQGNIGRGKNAERAEENRFPVLLVDGHADHHTQ